MSINKNFCLLFLGFLAWTILSYLSFDLFCVNRLLTQSFAYGTSSFKTYLFLLYAVTISLILIFNTSGKLLHKLKYPYLLSIPIFTLVLNFIGHLFYTFNNQLKITDFTTAVYRGWLSSNALFHTHCLKAVLGKFAALLGVEKLVGNLTDAGLAFLAFLPDWFLYLTAISALLSFVSLILLIRKILAEKYSNSIPMALLLIIASFTVMLRIFDGGLFAPEVTAALAFLFSSYQTEKGSSEKLLLSFLFNFCKLAVSLVIIQLLAFQNFSNFYWQISWSSFCFLALLLLFLLPPYRLSIKYRLVLIAFLLVQQGTAVMRSANKELIRTFFTSFTTDHYIYLLDRSHRLTDWPMAYRQDNLRIYKFKPTETVTGYDIYKKLNIRDNFDRINVSDQTCTENSSYRVPFSLKGQRQQIAESLEPASVLVTDSMIEKCEQGSDCDYKGFVEIRGCIVNPANSILINFLSNSGFESFILAGSMSDD